MQRIDGPTRSADLPAPAATGDGPASPGYFSRGNLSAGIPPTTLDADWANMVQEELVSVVAAAAIPLDKSNHGQVLQALYALFVAKADPDPDPDPNPDPDPDPEPGVVIGVDQISVPLAGGVILKAGTLSGSFGEGPASVAFDTPFPSRCIVAIPIVLNLTGGNTRDVSAQRQTMSAAGFTAFLQRSGGGGNTDSNDGIDWIALGI